MIKLKKASLGRGMPFLAKNPPAKQKFLAFHTYKY
jgi:hypothetical protein